MLIIISIDLCKNALIINSNGAGKMYDHKSLGRYKYIKELNGKPLYQHTNGNPYLIWSDDRRWEVCVAQNLKLTNKMNTSKY